MEDNKDNWEPCPRCGSRKVEKRGSCFFILSGFVLIGVSIWLLVIPPIGIAGIIIGVLLMFSSFFIGKTLQCQECKKTWKYPADENKYREKRNKKGE